MEKQVETVLRGARFKKMITSQLSGIIEKYGLKRVELEILYFLSGCGENKTSKDISLNLNMNKGHISQAVESLCRQGYLTAAQDKDDRRYVHYTITDKAKAISEDIARAWEEMIRKIFEGISEEEFKVFRKVAEKIEANMDHILNE